MPIIILSMLMGLSAPAHAQNIMVQGTVKDSLGAGIPSATVKIRNSKSGTGTDSLGRFSLTIKPGTILDITAIGYTDTSITVTELTPLTVVMQSRQNNLQDVVVGHHGNRSTEAFDPVANEQIIALTLSNFAMAAGYNSGSVASGPNSPMSSFGPMNRLNTGEMLPSFMPKEDTKGSRYLFPGYVGGVVIDSANTVIKNNAPIYNYDKISGSLIIRKDAQTCIEVDMAEVKNFALKSRDTTVVFMRVPSISDQRFCVFIAANAQYALFKTISTKFVRSQYRNTGLIVAGNNYDEYVDEYEYYLVALKGGAYLNLPLKKKAIKQAFAADQQKVDAWFLQHRNDDINEAFVKGLVEFID